MRASPKFGKMQGEESAEKVLELCVPEIQEFW